MTNFGSVKGPLGPQKPINLQNDSPQKSTESTKRILCLLCFFVAEMALRDLPYAFSAASIAAFTPSYELSEMRLPLM